MKALPFKKAIRAIFPGVKKLHRKPKTFSGAAGKVLGLLLFYATTPLTFPLLGYSYYSFRQMHRVQEGLNAHGITDLIIPDLVRKIPNLAFNHNPTLKRITIPASVIEIGQEAFLQCSSLTEISIPASVKTIGKEAFAYCNQITRVNISGEVNKRYDGRTLLHIAAESNSPEMMRALFDKDGINLLAVDAKTPRNHTPLLTYIRVMREGAPSNRQQKAATLFFHEYKAKIIRSHGQVACNTEMRHIADKLQLKKDDVTHGRLFEGLSHTLLQKTARDTSSTHKDIAHKTAAATGLALKSHYRSSKAFKIKRKHTDKTIRRFLAILKRHAGIKEGHSDLTLKEVFSYVWTAFHDASHLPEEERKQWLEDRRMALNTALKTLLNTYGKKSAACFGGLFNGLMHLAYTNDIPGAIVLMDEVEKSQCIQILEDRHGLIGRYSCLPPERKQTLLDNSIAFESWKIEVQEKQCARLDRYNLWVGLIGGTQPFLFLEKPLDTIRDSYKLTHSQFKEKLNIPIKRSLLPSFTGFDKSADDATLSFKFYEAMNFSSLYQTQADFLAVLKEANIIGDEGIEISSQKQLERLAEDFFDSQVLRCLFEVRGQKPELKSFYKQGGTGEHWQRAKEMQMEVLLGAPEGMPGKKWAKALDAGSIAAPRPALLFSREQGRKVSSLDKLIASASSRRRRRRNDTIYL